MAKVIQLAGQYSYLDMTVSECDYPEMSKHNWYACVQPHTTYARSWINGESVYAHRFIKRLQKHDGIVCDHKNGDGLCNVRSNLRTGTVRDNCRNRTKRKGTKNRYIGVYQRRNNRFEVYVNGKFRGARPTELEAVALRDQVAQQLHGRFVMLNANLKVNVDNPEDVEVVSLQFSGINTRKVP